MRCDGLLTANLGPGKEVASYCREVTANGIHGDADGQRCPSTGGTALAQSGRRAERKDFVGLHRRLMILTYQIEGNVVEFALREGDLPILGHVVNLPSVGI